MVVAGVLAGAAALAMLTGGGAPPAESAGPPAGGAPTHSAPTGVYWQRVHARFSPPAAFIPSSAVTYDMKVVPAASRIEVEQSTSPSGTRVTARLAGLEAGHAFGMRVHTRPCGSKPGAAGPRYLHGTGGRAAGPGDEVRLDFTTDARGAAAVSTRRGWNFRPGGAGSVVIDRGPGGAADPVACFTVPFGPTAGSAV